jgi:hypothetical protein
MSDSTAKSYSRANGPLGTKSNLYYKTFCNCNVPKMDILCSKLVCLSKPVKDTADNKNTSLRRKCPFSVR